MIMMDTRVGTPGADIPDDDLDFAVAVKLRLDRGEDVPDEDLDRAVAIKLRLAPAAAPAPAPTAMGPGGVQPYPRVQLPLPTPEQDAANQAQLLKDLEARYGPAPQPAGPNPSNVSLGEGGYTPPAPPQRGMLAEAENAFQAAAQSLEAGIGQAVAALGDVFARTGSPALGGQLQQARYGGIVEPAGAPSVLPEGTNPFYALAYKGTRMVAGSLPVLLAGAAIGPAVGWVAGLLAGAAPMAVEAGGHTYQAAVDAGIPEDRAMSAGLASAAVAQVAGSTQLGIILRKFPWLQQGVQNLVERRVTAYIAERGAEATFNGLVGVAQQAANDSIQVAHGINPSAFDGFWTEQAPEAFAGGALPTAVMGLGHDALRLPGAIAEQRRQADLQQAQAGARQVASAYMPNRAPDVQQRVEGPPAPVQRPPAPPAPAGGGPDAAPPAAAGTPDQPPARAPGAAEPDPYAAIDALRARMAGAAEPSTAPTPPPPSPAPAIKVGDLVQWTNQGVAQLPEPRKVEGFATWTDGRTYAKLEGSDTMVPLEELQPQPPAEPATSLATTGPAVADVSARVQAVADRVEPLLEAWQKAYRESEQAQADAKANPYDVQKQLAARTAAESEQEAIQALDDVSDVHTHDLIARFKKGLAIDPKKLERAEGMIRRNDKFPRAKKPGAPVPDQSQARAAEPAISLTTTPPPPTPAPPPPAPARQYPQRAPQRPAAPGPRPDLGSSRLNIPLSPEMEAERAQQTVQQNVSAWQREKANRDRPVPLPKVEPATEPPQSPAPPQAPESAGAAEGDRTSNPPPQPGESQHILDQWQNAGKGGPSPWPRFTPEQREEFVREVEKKPVVKGPMYRGLTARPDDLPKLLQDFSADPNAPTSWSLDEATADTYAPRNVGRGKPYHGIVWKLDPAADPGARDISSHPSNWTENEAVLLGGRRPRVTRVQLADESRKTLEAKGLSPDDFEPGKPGWENRVKDSPIGLLYEVDATLAPKPAPHPAASDQRERVHQEVRAAFGEQGAEALPLLDAYARSWTAATGRPAGEFYGRFSFEKGGGDGEGKGNKGSYRLLEDGRAIIRALDNPDASTLPHELGHAFLDFLHEIDPKLHAAAMKALGAAGETPTVENHERWSRAFEAYLREGKAPTSLLRATFEKFKSWLRDIYRSISRGPLAKKLTPELRQVFDEMLGRGDQPSEPAPTAKVREVGKRRTAPVERREWSKADIADRIQRKYENSPSYDADLSQEHVEGDLGGFTRFSGKIPGELLNELEGRPDLLKMLQPNSPAGTAGGADALAQLGAEGYVRRLTRWQQGQTKDTIAKLRRNIADPEAAFLADLWESTPKGGGKPKETVRAEDLAERGLRFTIDDRPASIIQKSGDLYLRVKDLGTYPLVAFDEVPVDKGSLAKGAGGKEMFQAAQDDRRDRPPTPPTSKLVDVAAYLATNQARLKRRGGGRVDNRTAAAALDRFLGHGKYGSELPEKVRGMANRMLARSLNKYGFTDPAALEARVGKAFRAAEIADRRAARPSRLQKALDQANGVRPEPTTQDAVDRAVAIERAHAEVGTAMQVRKAELAGEKKVAKLKDLLSEKGLQAAREMAAERRAARQQLIDQADRFRVKYLKAKLGGEEAGSKTGYKAGQADLQAMREEAADLVLKGLPRGERGRASILKAIRNATRQRDVYRLMEEVQHRAVSARAGEAWKQIRKLTRRKNLSALPEKAEDILGIADGENVREGVRKLLAQAKAAQETAKYQRAEPLRLARLINRRAAERAIFKDPASTPLQKALARDTIRAINEKIRNERPDLQPKVDAARRLAEIENEIRETTTKVKNADALWISNERRAARGMRKFMLARIGATTKIASAAGETKPGVSEGSNQSMARQAVFLNWTPDTLGQWLDNAIGKPEQAQFGHHLVFREPLRAAGMVAEEKVARLAALEELAKRHGFESWDHATAVISGTHGGGLQQTVDIDVPGWVDKRITMGEALKIFGDDQDAQTRQLSDDGMVHRLARRRDGHVAALEAGERAQIIQAIPQRFRDFYTELKELKEKMLGNRALEIRRRYRGTAPDTVPNREPRVREGDSDYVSDYFDSKSQSRSLLEQSFMKDRVQTPGPVNLVVDGLEGHMRDWDSQLHLIHHADLAYAMSKTLLHKDTLKALAVQGGEQAVERIQTLVDRILGTEIKGKSTAVDRAARVLRKNVGAGMTALSPKSFLKQFAVFPLLASLHPIEAMKAAKGLVTQKGLRERVMKANGLLAQRFHMADAAKAASAGMSNPIFDSGDFKLRVKAGLANLKDAAAQAGSGQIRNATKNTLRALGNFRDATTNLLRFNSWADEQGVKAAFLICEQLVDREHPNLNPADRERMIGLKTAEMVHRTMNTYDTLGQSFWRSDLDQKGAAGMLNMFSNDSTKQSNLAYQAMASRDKGLIARTFSGLALGAAYSVIAPALLSQGGAAVLRYFFGDSDSDTERRKSLRDRLAWTSTRELAGKIPIAGADLLADIGKLLVQGKGDVASTNSPAMQQVAALLRESSLAIYNTATNQADPEKSTLQNFEAQAAKSERARAAIGGAVRAGGTVAGVGAMPLVNLLREMKPNAEVYGLAANWARRGDEDKAAALLAGQVEAMRKAEIPEREIKDHLVEVVASRLNRDVEKDDEAGRRESDRTARRVVSAALSR